MSARTPGLWSYDAAGCLTSHGLPIITKANGHLVAALADRNVSNARLIAAAPRLLAALREAEKECRYANLARDGSQKPNTPAARVIAICRAAIDEVEGRS